MVDDLRFDSLARSIAEPASRRGLLGGLAGGLAALVGLAGETDAKKGKKHKKKKCKGNKKKCKGKCIKKSQCCKNNDCGDGAVCSGKQCVCGTGTKDCDGACVSETACCANSDCSDPTKPVCDAGVCVCEADGDTCESGDSCCTGVCACDGGKEGNPETGICHADSFNQDFASNVDGWFDWDNDADTWPGGHTTIQQVDGHAVLQPGDYNNADLTPMTLWGGYSSVFPQGGYNTEIDVFLDPITTNANTRFSFSSAINLNTCSYHSESMFHAGTDESGTFCVSAGGGASTQPCNDTFNPFTIDTADWYTLRHQFRDNGNGEVKVTMRLIQGNTVLATWSETASGDPLGGNRYGWFPFNNFNALQIDNSKRS